MFRKREQTCSWGAETESERVRERDKSPISHEVLGRVLIGPVALPESERESACVCEREREREKEREREIERMRVCVCERDRERERERKSEKERLLLRGREI